MKVVVGNLWDQEHIADVILVTTNCIVNSAGKLVMGRGAALEAATRYPRLPMDFGDIIREKKYGTTHPYGILILPKYANEVQLGAFQVKHHWQERAMTVLIKLSAYRLNIIANACPHMTFAINYPGIGNGQLSERDVAPLISSLPDNVTFYKKEY